MNDFTYSSLGNKINKTQALPVEEFDKSIKDLLVQEHYKFIGQEDAIKAFCGDLKRILSIGSIHEMIAEIFSLENNLKVLSSKTEIVFDVPKLEKFFQDLSPVLLRSMWECLEEGIDIDHILYGWMESLRIALEEELYIWQEKII